MKGVFQEQRTERAEDTSGGDVYRCSVDSRAHEVWKGGVDGRLGLIECPRHRHLQPLVAVCCSSGDWS